MSKVCSSCGHVSVLGVNSLAGDLDAIFPLIAAGVTNRQVTHLSLSEYDNGRISDTSRHLWVPGTAVELLKALEIF